MAETEEQGGGTADPRLDAINDYTLKTLKVCEICYRLSSSSHLCSLFLTLFW